MNIAEGRVYACVDRFIENHGYPPTLAEVADLCGYSSRATTHKAVWSLINQGYLAGKPGRSLRLGDRLPVPAPD